MKIFPVYYFPPVSWFSALAREDKVLLEACEFYRKQHFFNRMQIQTANKVLGLSIPIKKAKEYTPIKMREISYAENWQRIHWMSLTSAYRSSPYFEYYEDRFQPLFEEQTASLFELNFKVIEMLLDILQIETELELTSQFKESEAYDYDFRKAFSSKDKAAKPWFNAAPYTQVFGSEFAEDLSIFDLICCLGPASAGILQESYQQL